MKPLLLAVSVAIALSACSSTRLLSWKPAAEPTNVPTEVQTLARSADAATTKLKKNKSENNIIAYFNADGELVNTPQEGGFYRKLLGRNSSGFAIVQDFYQDNDAKQTNPIIIPNDKDLKNFDSAIGEGRVIWYSPTGKITEFLDYHHGLVQRGGYYNDEGKLVLETEGDNSKDVNATVKMRGYYENGQLLFENTQKKDTSESIFYYDNGQKMWHGVSSSEAIHAWTKDGKPTNLSDITDAVSAAEHRALELMQKYLNQ